MKTKLWGSRFKKPFDETVDALISSLKFDSRLAAYDVQGCIAHAQMLGKQKIIPQSDAKRLVSGLQRVAKKIDSGKIEPDKTAEDVHTWIAQLLKKEIGQVADKLHTARSRNDQVVLDVRLYTRDMIKDFLHKIRECQLSILKVANYERNTLIPAYTHLRQAQCVSVAQHFLAYVEMLDRDYERLTDAYVRVDVMPLGACALSGSSLPIDRDFVAKKLKFSSVSRNSMDTVSDRDFMLEVLGSLSILAMHLSRVAEELILWSGTEFDLVKIDESLMTGSSIMPHKQNPDPLEIVRGMAGQIYGQQISLLVVMKGLTLTYHRDLQHDKESLFIAHEKMMAALVICRKVFDSLKINRKRAKDLVSNEDLFSVDIVDYLIRKGVSYRDAHDVTGALLLFCAQSKKKIATLTLKELNKIHTSFALDIRKLLDAKNSVGAKESIGGTGPRSVTRQLKYWKVQCSTKLPTNIRNR